MFQGKELLEGGRVEMRQADGVATLTLNHITADDSGKYIVMAENRFGMDCHYASLAVEGDCLARPRIPLPARVQKRFCRSNARSYGVPGR